MLQSSTMGEDKTTALEEVKALQSLMESGSENISFNIIVLAQ